MMSVEGRRTKDEGGRKREVQERRVRHTVGGTKGSCDASFSCAWRPPPGVGARQPGRCASGRLERAWRRRRRSHMRRRGSCIVLQHLCNPRLFLPPRRRSPSEKCCRPSSHTYRYRGPRARGRRVCVHRALARQSCDCRSRPATPASPPRRRSARFASSGLGDLVFLSGHPQRIFFCCVARRLPCVQCLIGDRSAGAGGGWGHGWCELRDPAASGE